MTLVHALAPPNGPFSFHSNTQDNGTRQSLNTRPQRHQDCPLQMWHPWILEPQTRNSELRSDQSASCKNNRQILGQDNFSCGLEIVVPLISKTFLVSVSITRKKQIDMLWRTSLQGQTNARVCVHGMETFHLSYYLCPLLTWIGLPMTLKMPPWRKKNGNVLNKTAPDLRWWECKVDDPTVPGVEEE